MRWQPIRHGYRLAIVLLREIVALGYTGGGSQLRAYMHGLAGFADGSGGTVRDGAERADASDWIEFRKDKNPLYAFCAILGYSRMSFVELVTDMKV